MQTDMRRRVAAAVGLAFVFTASCVSERRQGGPPEAGDMSPDGGARATPDAGMGGAPARAQDAGPPLDDPPPRPMPPIPLEELGACGQAGAQDQDIVLTLDDALWDLNEQGKLRLTFPCRGGRFTRDFYAELQPATASTTTSLTLNDGLVVKATSEGDKVQLDVVVQYENDADRFKVRTPHEFIGKYKLELTRAGPMSAGKYSGTVSFSTNGEVSAVLEPKPVSGNVSGGSVAAWPPLVVKDHAAPGEHPRLFFRKADLPQLRQRAKTPQGQAVLAKLARLFALESGGFGGWGGAWEKNVPPYTEASWAAGHCLKYLLDDDRAAAARAARIAFLAISRNGGEAGAWGNALRISHLAVAYDLCYDAWEPAVRAEIQTFFAAANRGRHKVDGQWDAMWATGEGLAYLATLGDPYPAPRKPVTPEQAVALAPVAGWTPPMGVPVSKFASGQVAEGWLVAGTFDLSSGEDPLMAIGGRANARPTPGMSVAHGKTTATWSAKKFGYPMWLYGFSPGQPLAGDPTIPGFAYFYAVIDNDAARVVKTVVNGWVAQFGPNMPTFRQRMWIAGREVKDGDALRLMPGLYPVMFELPMVSQIMTGPQLIEYTSEVHKEDLLAFEEEEKSWKEQGGATPFVDRKLRRASLLTNRYLRYALGARGSQQEDNNPSDALHNLLPFAQAFRNVTGRDLTAGAEAGLDWVVPWHLATSGRLWRNDWGNPYWRVFGFRDQVAEPFRPALRAAMDADPALGVTLPVHAVYALTNYPWDVPAKAGKEAGLPLVIADEKFGNYVFRQGWGNDDFAAIFMGRQRSLRSSVTAGDVGLVGPGGSWLGYSPPAGGWFPSGSYEPWYPGTTRIAGAAPTRGGKIVHQSLKDNGSGTVTLVQDHWVAADVGIHSGPTLKGPDNLGITELRAFGADTSGASGAPMLIALVDKVTGHGDRAVSQVLAVRDQGFVVTGSGARSFTLARQAGGSLAVTVVAGGAQGIPANGAKNPRVVLASGPEIFLVITASTGPAPPVSVTGQGLAATVTVGDQTVRFDGQKVVFAK